MKISYAVKDGQGTTYFHKKSDAFAFFRNTPSSKSIEKHYLTVDCFERAYNAQGGFIEKIEKVYML